MQYKINEDNIPMQNSVHMTIIDGFEKLMRVTFHKFCREKGFFAFHKLFKIHVEIFENHIYATTGNDDVKQLHYRMMLHTL